MTIRPLEIKKEKIYIQAQGNQFVKVDQKDFYLLSSSVHVLSLPASH